MSTCVKVAVLKTSIRSRFLVFDTKGHSFIINCKKGLNLKVRPFLDLFDKRFMTVIKSLLVYPPFILLVTPFNFWFEFIPAPNSDYPLTLSNSSFKSKLDRNQTKSQRSTQLKPNVSKLNAKNWATKLNKGNTHNYESV